MRKRKKSSDIEGKEACFSSMMTIVVLSMLDFMSRDMEKDDLTKKSQEFFLKPLVLGQNGPKSWKETFIVIFSKT